LSNQDWNAIELVSSWLEEFAEVTALMSSTSNVTISSVILLFLGSFEKLEEAIATLPLHTPIQVKDGLIKAHQKLAKYHDKTDSFPYYLWAICECMAFLCIFRFCSLTVY
ncbi:hypothetical protein BT69DRAFT_1218450, partial [Atractiella rhizophila]